MRKLFTLAAIATLAAAPAFATDTPRGALGGALSTFGGAAATASGGTPRVPSMSQSFGGGTAGLQMQRGTFSGFQTNEASAMSQGAASGQGLSHGAVYGAGSMTFGRF